MKSLIRATCFLSFREPAERALLLTVSLCLCSLHAQGQNVEGQIVASQYGEWKVPSIGIGFTFDPASCQLSGGGKNFAAFSNGTPIKVVDENPGLTEVSNATVYAHVDSSSCSVSLGGLAYGHTSFYLTSGTGGLQEALNNALIRVGGPNTIILNEEWYELVAPGNPAAVIGTVIGGSGFGLVDVTTAPYTYYSWSGGHFNVVSSGGGSPTGLAGGSLSGTYPNPALSSMLVLPPATTATTQSNGDNSTKLATTAYVAANSGGVPSGSAGGSLSGTYPNPGLSSTVAIPSGATATTQTTGDNSTRVATDAFVQANLPGVPVSSVFGRTGAISANSGDYSVSQVTGAAPLASPAFTGTPTAPTQTAGDNSTKVATDAFVLANAGGGGPPSGSAGGSLSGTYPNPGLSSTVAIPSGATATTQTTGDNSTKVATDAFVLANAGGGGPPSGSAGGSLSGTYPNPGLSSTVAIPSGATATTQTTGDNSTKVATDAFVQANLPSVPVSSVFGRTGAISANSGDYSVAQVTGAAPLASPAFTGTPTAPTQTAGDNSTKIATDAFVLANAGGGGPPSGSAGGSLSGTYPNPQLAWKVVVLDNVNGAGIGVAPSAWSAGTYPWCTVVSHSGQNYIEENSVGDSVTTPGTNSGVWYPITNGARSTKADCAFYYAAASISSGTGTTTNGNGAVLIAGAGQYAMGIGFREPTVTSPGNPTVSIFGQGPQVTVFQQGNNNGDGLPALYQTPSTINYDLARLTWQGFTIDANEDAPAVVGLYGCQQCVINDVDMYNAAPGSDHYFEIGASGNMAWVYELSMHNVQLGANGHGGGGGATFSTTVTGGVPAVTVTASGSNYNVSWPPTPVLIQPGGTFCSGTNTLTYSAGTITGFTTTATGCASGTTAQVYGGPNVSYGFKFTNMSDSHDIYGLTGGGIGSVDAFYISNVTSFNEFHKLHPIGSMDGIQNNGSNNFYSTQMDTVLRRGFDFESGYGMINVYGSMFEWNNANVVGAGDYYFGAVGTPPASAPYSLDIYGDMCGANNTHTGYWHFSSAGTVIDTTSAGMPSTVHVHETNYCNQDGNNPTNAPDFVGLQYNWSPGAFGNTFQWNMNPTAGGTPQLNLTNPQSNGIYDLLLSNATAATSGANLHAPAFEDCSAYWNGSTSIPLCAQLNLFFNTGSNPLATLAFAFVGTLPSAGARYTFDNPVILPTASTAVTQTAGDNTTKIATDAFVLANVGSTVWSGLLSPTGALSLSMQAYQSVFTFNAATGNSDLFKLTDTTNNTGTGILNHITTAAGSTETPWQADANGTGWQISTGGALQSTDAIRNAAVTFQPGSGGAATCPTAASGSSFLCTNANDGISYSNNGAAYSPLSAQAIPFTITSSASPAINLNNGSVQTLTLSANATATVSNITSGVSLTMQICQPASGGPYTWTWPSAIHGGITIGTTATECSMQEFRSFNGTTLVAINSGAINVAP